MKAGNGIGLRTASEVFADRTYQQDGSLTSRRLPNALITDTEQAVGQVVRMIKESKVTTVQGMEIPLRADTVCLHGDGAHALSFAQRIRERLTEEGILIQAAGSKE